MSKCVECGKNLGPLDIYQESAQGLVCGKCLMHATRSPGAGPDRSAGSGTCAHAKATVRLYSVTEQAFLPLVPAGSAKSASTIRQAR